MISVVIPCLNEEDYIGRLLDCLIEQRIKDIEVLIVDGMSDDSTQKIVKGYSKKHHWIRLLTTEVRNISFQRNLGAENAKHDRLLFLDADVTMPKDFLRKNMAELKRKRLDLAGVFVEPLSHKFLDKLYHWNLNLFMFITQRFYPHMPGFCIFSRKSVHEKLKGFDRTIKLAEDMDYLNRAKKIAKFGMLGSSKIFCSVRRFRREGYLTTGFKYIVCPLYRSIFGEIRSDIFNYRFAHYKDGTKKERAKK